SAYTYGYATLGEFWAWIIGWDLILEYLFAASTVSVGWSGYFVALMHEIGFDIPAQFASAPLKWVEAHKAFEATGTIVNLPAVALIGGITLLLVVGIKESATFNNIAVFIKTGIVLAVITFGFRYVNTANWHPFIPPEGPEGFGHFGWSGIVRGSAVVFFAYIGFDAVSTAAQETKNPQRDLPIGILASLAICTVLYIAVSLILTGVVPYSQLDVPHPIALGVEATGQRWLATAVEIGAIAGLSSVMLVMLLGQPRIFFAMASDGLFPPVAARIHPRYGTPYITTIVTGLICALMGGVLPIDILAELTSIGTLFAFALVSLGVMILRLKRPNIPRAFKAPGGPYVVPILGVVTSVGLMAFATAATVIRLFVWM